MEENEETTIWNDIEVTVPATISIWYQKDGDWNLYTALFDGSGIRAYVDNSEVTGPGLMKTLFFEAMIMVRELLIYKFGDGVAGKGYRPRVWSKILSSDEISILVQKEKGMFQEGQIK